MSALLAALLGSAALVQPSADSAMQTLLNTAVTLRTFDDVADRRHLRIPPPDHPDAAIRIAGHACARRSK